MNIRATRLASAVAMILSGAAALAQDTSDDTFRFEARLSGAQEVVPADAPATPSLGVTTESAGGFVMQVARDLSSLDFRLTVTSVTGVTQAHLHCARAGENGPIVVPLIEPNQQGRDVSGVLGQGRITNELIVANAAECEEAIGRPVRNIASLAAAAFEGLIYANVHTVVNPDGEIRGQLVPGDDDDDDDGPTPTRFLSGARR